MRKLLRRGQIGLPISTLWEYQRLGLYPKFFKFGVKSSGLYEDEHTRVMALRAGGCTDQQLRRLVDQIHQERKDAAAEILGGESSWPAKGSVSS